MIRLLAAQPLIVQPDSERRKHGALQAVAFLEEQRPRAGLLLVVLSGHVAASSRARRIPRSEQEHDRDVGRPQRTALSAALLAARRTLS
jgi:hypothetical protein